MLYFDHNATHPLSDAAREAWLRATRDFIGNPSSPHRLGARAETALDQAREKLAGWLGCAPTDIVWTSGRDGGEQRGAASRGAGSEGEAWISAIEHPCVLEAARRHFAGRHALIPVTREGVVEVEWLAERLQHKAPAVVAMMAANNETGVLQPWREVLALCRERGVPFFCDAAQWIGKLPSSGLGSVRFRQRVRAQIRRTAGRRFPQSAGEVSRAAGRRTAGGRPSCGNGECRWSAGDGRGAGGTRGAICTRRNRITRRLRDEFERALVAALPGVRIVGAGADRLWNTVSAVMPEMPDCRQRWVVKLDKLGFAVSTGSACASGKEETSHVLAAMGLTPSQASRVLRFSSGWRNTRADWDGLLEGLRQAQAASQTDGAWLT